jgi:hypothetical protein
VIEKFYRGISGSEIEGAATPYDAEKPLKKWISE